ncbi:MAG TPA: tautomerase family protein [Candidatus Binatia bacterium]|nr:tautomerase family protein [Candidatus Binatia bacterium]
MPLIKVKLIDDVFAPEQKRKAIAELTRAIVSVQGKQPVTLVVIEEEAGKAQLFPDESSPSMGERFQRSH